MSASLMRSLTPWRDLVANQFLEIDLEKLKAAVSPPKAVRVS
ncbi:hypothetical protein ACVWZV_000120 [Bradyrhizobium sp. GM5.1]